MAGFALAEILVLLALGGGLGATSLPRSQPALWFSRSLATSGAAMGMVLYTAGRKPASVTVTAPAAVTAPPPPPPVP